MCEPPGTTDVTLWKTYNYRDDRAKDAARDKADRDWAREVKRRANSICEVCGKRGTEAAHIISRRYAKTRHVVANGACLCAKDHREHHGHVLKIFGRDENGKLRWERPDEDEFSETIADA